MIVETTLAIISSIALTILIKQSFCADNSMSYEVMVSLNRFLTNRCVLSQIIYRMTTPKIEPINIEEYIVKQSKYQVVGTLQTQDQVKTAQLRTIIC